MNDVPMERILCVSRVVWGAVVQELETAKDSYLL